MCYIPRDGHVTGLSKISRCVNGYAKRPQLQERLTAQIADAMVRELDPLGVLVVLEAEHLHDHARHPRGLKTVTSAVRGCLKEIKCRQEAMQLMLGSNCACQTLGDVVIAWQRDAPTAARLPAEGARQAPAKGVPFPR